MIESNPVAMSFFRQCCGLQQNYSVREKKLFHAYRDFCKERGIAPLQNHGFRQQMRLAYSKAYTTYQTPEGGPVLLGIALKDDPARGRYGLGNLPPVWHPPAMARRAAPPAPKSGLNKPLNASVRAFIAHSVSRKAVSCVCLKEAHKRFIAWASATGYGSAKVTKGAFISEFLRITNAYTQYCKLGTTEVVVGVAFKA